MDGVSGKFWQYGTIGLTSNRLLATPPQYTFLLLDASRMADVTEECIDEMIHS